MKKTLSSTVSRFFKTHVVDALSYMAMGLFCSLILGLIIKQIALIPGLDFLSSIAALLQSAPVVGGSIGMAIGLGLKRAPLVTISAVAVGALGYQFGGPIGAYLASIVGLEAGSLVSKKTPVDIIITPLVAVVAGGLFAKYCCSPINEWVMSLGTVINRATLLHPFVMGLIVSVSVGCLLTLPISSAALCISIVIAAPNTRHMEILERMTKQFLCGFGNQSLSPERFSQPIAKLIFVVLLSKVIAVQSDTADRFSAFFATNRIRFGC